MSRRPMVLFALLGCVAAVGACGGDDDSSVSTPEAPSVMTVAEGDELEIVVETDLVYLTDEESEWTLHLARPAADGPWPLIVIVPPQAPSNAAVRDLAERGAVVVQGDAWVQPDAFVRDPDPHLYGAMDRAACIVSWAQAHAGDYDAVAEVTTITGYSGGAMAATWVGLGLADDSNCDDPIAHLPVALAPGESQFLFHHARWDPAFASGDPEPRATLAGLFDSENWNVSPDLRVGLWSAADPIGETRAIENPPADDSWIWLRDDATPVVDDLTDLGAFDDEKITWRDNALLMEQRMQLASIDVRNEVYDLIFELQPDDA